jgi:hypothetical protein
MNLPATLNTLEGVMQGLPQVACDVVHAFAPGIYIRQVTLRAGSFVMGHHHRQAHLNIMVKGHLTLFATDGTRSELYAPVICVAEPGRKVAYVHEDTLWLNLYATTETDVEKLEATYLEITEGWQSVHDAFHMNRDADREDFDNFLWETGLSAESVRIESENTVDQMPFPQGAYKCKVGPSDIQGKGLLACADIAGAEIIAPARLDGKRTPAGRYTNHAKVPNAQMIAHANGDIFLMSVKPIGGSLGGQAGEEITVNYRQALTLNQLVTQ